MGTTYAAATNRILFSSPRRFVRILASVDMFWVDSASSDSDAGTKLTTAGIQSVFRHACDLGSTDLIIVDEAHCIPPDGDPVADRALMEAAGVEAEIEATGFSLEAALDLAGALVKLGVVVAGMMA